MAFWIRPQRLGNNRKLDKGDNINLRIFCNAEEIPNMLLVRIKAIT